MYADGDMQLQPIDRRKFDQYNYVSEDEDGDDYDVSSDEGRADQRRAQQVQVRPPPQKNTTNWNDIPEDFLHAAPKAKPTVRMSKTQEWDDWGKEN
jgi:palmitoyltransferase